jgi:uncharacterized protein (DUF2267 family)
VRIFPRMSDAYRVRGGVGPPLPGVVGPADLDGRVEWVPVRRSRDLLDELAARLGSEVDLHKVVLAVFLPLRADLDGAPLGALLAHLPLSLGGQLAAGGAAVGTRVPSPAGPGDYLVHVARLVQQPPWRAATCVRAVFAAARAVLAAEDAEAIAARLPGGLADLWRGA